MYYPNQVLRKECYYPIDRHRSTMDRNVCGIERVLRFIVAVGLLRYGYRGRDSYLGTLAFVIGSDLLATSVIGRCPVTILLGFNSCKDR